MDTRTRRQAQPKPDAWMQLVLRSMSTEEIKQVLVSGEETDPVRVQWLMSELQRRGK